MKFTYYFKYKKLITNILIFGIIFYLLMHSKVLVTSISKSTNIFITKLIPALFPYLLITEILINSGKVNNLSYGLSSAISKLFAIPKHTTASVIIGFLLGYPNSAKYILKMYNDKQIDSKVATKLISFTSNANMSYIIASIGIGMFRSIEVGIILTISHFLSAIIIGIFFTPSYNNNIIQQTNTNSNSFNKISSPFELLYVSIYGTLKTLAFIFSYTVIFSLIPTVVFSDLNVPQTLKAVITGIFEISNGINAVQLLDISLNTKIILTSFILSFSSLMILVQIFSFAFKAKVKFGDLVKYKLIQGIISCIITYMIITYIYTPILPVYITKDMFVSPLNILPSTIYMFAIFITIILSLILFRKKRQGKPVA